MSGTRTGETVHSSTGYMLLQFNSDTSQSDQGFDVAWTSRTVCSRGFFPAGSTCLPCDNETPPDAFYPANTCQWQCEAGFYLSEGACVACPPTMSSAAGSVSVAGCNECDRGFTGPDGGPCVACEAGTYKSEPGPADCSACGTGLFQELPGQSACSSCDAGVYHSGTAAQAVCASCPQHSFSQQQSHLLRNCSCEPGFTGPDGGPCVACAPGKYKAGTGSMACAECAAGMYETSSASVECWPCPSGTYHSGPRSESSCVACPAHSHAPEQSYLVTNCSCLPGFTGPAGGPCVACEPG
eukprot:2929429-Rhodomonas_salina.1